MTGCERAEVMTAKAEVQGPARARRGSANLPTLANL